MLCMEKETQKKTKKTTQLTTCEIKIQSSWQDVRTKEREEKIRACSKY